MKFVHPLKAEHRLVIRGRKSILLARLQVWWNISNKFVLQYFPKYLKFQILFQFQFQKFPKFQLEHNRNWQNWSTKIKLLFTLYSHEVWPDFFFNPWNFLSPISSVNFDLLVLLVRNLTCHLFIRLNWRGLKIKVTRINFRPRNIRWARFWTKVTTWSTYIDEISEMKLHEKVKIWSNLMGVTRKITHGAYSNTIFYEPINRTYAWKLTHITTPNSSSSSLPHFSSPQPSTSLPSVQSMSDASFAPRTFCKQRACTHYS